MELFARVMAASPPPPHLKACEGLCVSCTSTQQGVDCVFVRGVKLKPPSPADGHTEDGLTQEQWAPLTRNDAPKTCGLLSPWQPPMGQGEHG